MAVLKRNSVFCGGGVDISNRVVITRPPVEEIPAEPVEEYVEPAPAEPIKPDIAAELELRMQLLEEREAQVEAQQQQLAALKDQYIEQARKLSLRQSAVQKALSKKLMQTLRRSCLTQKLSAMMCLLKRVQRALSRAKRTALRRALQRKEMFLTRQRCSLRG